MLTHQPRSINGERRITARKEPPNFSNKSRPINPPPVCAPAGGVRNNTYPPSQKSSSSRRRLKSRCNFTFKECTRVMFEVLLAPLRFGRSENGSAAKRMNDSSRRESLELLSSMNSLRLSLVRHSTQRGWGSFQVKGTYRDLSGIVQMKGH